MKTLILLALALLTTPAQAQSEDAVKNIAHLLSSGKVAPCLAQLNALPYQAWVNNVESVDDGKNALTTISYILVSGDIAEGGATLTIREAYLPHPLFQEMLEKRVQGCDLTADTISSDELTEEDFR